MLHILLVFSLLAVLQKVETPSRKAESVPKYEERTSKFDDTLTSGDANPDKVQHCAPHLHHWIQQSVALGSVCIEKPCQLPTHAHLTLELPYILQAIFGTEVGVTDAMRFQGAAPEVSAVGHLAG